MIVTDIDGTLIRESSDTMDPEMLRIIRNLKEKGVRFVGASGRQYGSIRRIFEPEEEQMYYIAENGSAILSDHEVFDANQIEFDLARELIEFLRKIPDSEVLYSTPFCQYVESRDEAYIFLLRDGYHNELRVCRDVLEEGLLPNKIALYVRKGTQEVYDEIKRIWGERLNVVAGGKCWIDFMNAGIDKSRGVHMLCERFGILTDEVMAFGDQDNDIGMLRASGYAVAVANASEKAKEAADYITDSWEEHGVPKVLQGLLDHWEDQEACLAGWKKKKNDRT